MGTKLNIQNLAWLMYAAIILAIGWAYTARKIINDTGGLSSRAWPPLAATVIAVGLVASLRGVAAGPRAFWIAVLWVSVAASAALAIFGLALMAREHGAGILWSAAIVLAALVPVPAQVKLFRYAHRSPGIWNRPRASPTACDTRDLDEHNQRP